MDFFRLITNPRCCNEKIAVSVAIRTSLINLPSNNMSSRKIFILIFSLLIKDIGTSKILVKILGAGPKTKHRQEFVELP